MQLAQSDRDHVTQTVGKEQCRDWIPHTVIVLPSVRLEKNAVKIMKVSLFELQD